MKKSLILTLFVIVVFACKQENEVKKPSSSLIETTNSSENTFGMIIHGGAGTIVKEHMNDSLEAAYYVVLEAAAKRGHDILASGGSSVAAVAAAIEVMEDSPLFNAGKGAVFTNEETNELDASIMDGKSQNAGAVSGVTNVKNPIQLAIEVMNNSSHVMLSGRGAEAFARERGLELVDSSYFFTKARYESLKRIKDKEKTEVDHDAKIAYADAYLKDSKFGTVGAAALDKDGNLSAGTSTGGMTNKKWNRIGDAPIIGAGTYAKNTTCAVSSTGWGEFFIRAVAAYDISALMEYKGLSLQDAAKEVVQKKIPQLGGDGGIVAIDSQGNMVAEFNTPGMYRATVNAAGEVTVGMYNEED